MKSISSNPHRSFFRALASIALCALLLLTTLPGIAQQKSEKSAASVNTSISQDGTGSIIVEARGIPAELPVFYTASSNATAQVSSEYIQQNILLSIKVKQGKADTLSFALNGDGEITEVKGEHLRSWSIRRKNDQRFLDLQIKKDSQSLSVHIKTRSQKFELPHTLPLTHLAPDQSIGFQSKITINTTSDLISTISAVKGFRPLKKNPIFSGARSISLQSHTGGLLVLSLNRSDATPAPIELLHSSLKGSLHPNGKSILFKLQATAQVTKKNAVITILSGDAAIQQIPNSPHYRLELLQKNDKTFYQLAFNQIGSFPLNLDFVAKVKPTPANSHSLDFTIAASAITPIDLTGLDANLEFLSAAPSIVPSYQNKSWLAFLPATGRAKLQWKSTRKTGTGKLFFSTTAQVEAKVSAGLLRQDHQITYKILQGELPSLQLQLHGPGEILDVQGKHITAWKLSEQKKQRLLSITLSQAITSSSQIQIRSQTPLGAFPLRVEGLRLNPTGAIRHSGYLRISNLGSVRLEPTALSGLTQLSPDQFPGKAIKSRQVFIYRFPAADHHFEIAADRIQSEVNISQVVLYQLTPSDRVIQADIELDIREAAIREWNFSIPSDYSVVAITGAAVADYITASEVKEAHRNLKVIFTKDVAGRQLVSLHLEKNQVAAAGDWILPRIEYPDAKTVRGNIGIVGAAGYRIAVGESEKLVEKPLSYFPKATANLQQAFRIREPAWSATMQIEQLARSVQADVFHLYSLSDRTLYVSTLINYFVTGAPVSEWRITVPENLANVMVDGQDVRTWRREEDTLIISLHQPVMGPYTLLLTSEEKPDPKQGNLFKAAQITPLDVQAERGYIQIASPMQVKIDTLKISDNLLKLDPLELPAEFRLLSASPSLGIWQYTERPFTLDLKVDWFQPGNTLHQVVEFAEANSRVSKDGELVTQVLYYVKSRGATTLKLKLPEAPVRLWEVSVGGKAVTARQADNGITLIPLPDSNDPNSPIEVSLRLGKPAVDASKPVLDLPIVFAPVLKTEWLISGDQQRVLVPGKGNVQPPLPILRPSGFHWLAEKGSTALLVILLLSIFGSVVKNKSGALRILGILATAAAVFISLITALAAARETGPPSPLQLSLPILSAQEAVQLQVKNMPLWSVNLSWIGLTLILIGIVALISSLITKNSQSRALSFFLIALGTLLQGNSAAWFFGLLAISLLLSFFLAQIKNLNKEKPKSPSPPSPSATATALLTIGLLIASSFSSPLQAADAETFKAADSIQQQWQILHQDQRLTGKASITLSGRPGDRFLLLKSPATLTNLQAKGLRLTKRPVPGIGLAYILSIPFSEKPKAEDLFPDDPFAEEIETTLPTSKSYTASFEFQLEGIKDHQLPVLTGTAALQEILVTYDEAGWQVISPSAVRIETLKAAADHSKIKVLLGPGSATLTLAPKARDLTMEKNQFFVETSNLYLPSPGVIDGRHRIHIRSSQGQVNQLKVIIPSGLTVSEVNGPVGSWQFDADSRQLQLAIEPAQSSSFDVMIDTQRGLSPLPADVKLAPLKVLGSNGELGLLAIAFGPDAQPEKTESATLSAVNPGDFDASLIPNKSAVLHRVYRYGAKGGELALRIAPVESEVRVTSKQVLSLGDERIVLGVNFTAEITRAGLFQLSFALPEGLEVESLTGASLHHWAELNEGDQTRIILHLNGKTLGLQQFSLSLSGTTPSDTQNWQIPRFEIKEAKRQSGELVIKPTTGIRLRTLTRQNLSESDPRTMGGKAQGALAFRLLQRDWNLVLGIEKLDPWITGQALHEVTLREGQTRHSLIANFHIKNASIRSLQIELPISDEDVIKTLRASGDTVSDLIRSAPDSNVWQVHFKRRVVGKVQFLIEYERRGDRSEQQEILQPASFPQARQLSYYFAVRASGRLEVTPTSLPQGWQLADWNTLPATLRTAGKRNSPMLSLKTLSATEPLALTVTRHSIADALKLRVAKGTLTTVLSPTGDQLTAVDVTMEVIQRSSLSVELPSGGQLFSIFVNGESVHSVRQGDHWQFYILPGTDDRTATVRFVYSMTGEALKKINLTSPLLNVPLENITWNVVAPKGFELSANDGDLELKQQSHRENYNRSSYLSISQGKRRAEAQQASQLLDQANQLLQSGQQGKARWALNNVANRYALDAASNEDARVQLENLQTQQAVVGLNTRRQRLLLDNQRHDLDLAVNQQLKAAAAQNKVLQQGQLNFRPQQISQLLMGNSVEDNAMLQQIAERLVHHQRSTEPAPQAFTITLPEEGTIYSFSRSVQVTENTPLELKLRFGSQASLKLWQGALVLLLLASIAGALTLSAARKR